MKWPIFALGICFSLGVMATDFQTVDTLLFSAPDALDCGEQCDNDYAECKTKCQESDPQCPIACYSTYVSCLSSCSR